jgi:hypothetical protein|nr:MAG TPA: hypothetical protein [Caudoviricetes sp.]
MKVVLSTVLDFESLEDLAAACAECIENSDLTSLDDGVPEDWDLPEVWNEEAIKNFLKFNGSLFARDQGIDLDSDLFNDNYSETRVEIEE